MHVMALGMTEASDDITGDGSSNLTDRQNEFVALSRELVRRS
jgi:hypothetical protein